MPGGKQFNILNVYKKEGPAITVPNFQCHNHLQWHISILPNILYYDPSILTIGEQLQVASALQPGAPPRKRPSLKLNIALFVEWHCSSCLPHYCLSQRAQLNWPQHPNCALLPSMLRAMEDKDRPSSSVSKEFYIPVQHVTQSRKSVQGGA